MVTYLARHGESSSGWIFNKTLRFREGVLEEGETVAVVGQFFWEPDPEPMPGEMGGGYRDHPVRLVVRAPKNRSIFLSDDPSAMAG